MEAPKNTETTDTTSNTVATPTPDEVVAETSVPAGTKSEQSSLAETPSLTPDVSVEVTPTTIVPQEVTEAKEVAAPTVESSTMTPVALSKSQLFKQYGVAAVVVLVIGLILWYGLERQGRVHTGVFDSITALVSPEPAAAVVNGTVISMAEYDRNKQQLIVSAQQQGMDTTDTAVVGEIEKQAIDTLINTELLRQGAKEADIVVTSEQVEARYQEVLTAVGGAEVLATRMAEIGIDEPGLRHDIEGELLIQAYLAKAVDTTGIAITEADMRQVYDQAATTVPNLPAFEEVKTEIESQLRFTKEQELVNAFIESLRAKAKVDVRI